MIKRPSIFVATLFATALLGNVALVAQDSDPVDPKETPSQPSDEAMDRLMEFNNPDIFGHDPNAPKLTNWRDARPNQADYPPEAWLAGAEGAVGYRIDVDETGKATSCAVTQSSGTQALDEATCKILMARAEFEPRLNENGEAIKGVYTSRHRWRKGEPEIPGAFRFLANFVIDEKGEATNCTIEAMDGSLPEGMRENIERNPCPFSRGRNRAPYRDENGVPVAKQISVEFSARVSDVGTDTPD